MRTRIGLGSLITVGLLSIPSRAVAAEPDVHPDLHVVVRVYNPDGVVDDVDAVLAEADRPLRATGVDVVWVLCRERATNCQTPLAPNERVVRLIRVSNAFEPQTRWALGYSYLDGRSSGGTLATVHAERVEWLAGLTKTSATTLFGRAIAHEVGHLLIGSNGHSTRGLMRAEWTATELQRNRESDWQFSREDAERFRRGVLMAARAQRPRPQERARR